MCGYRVKVTKKILLHVGNICYVYLLMFYMCLTFTTHAITFVVSMHICNKCLILVIVPPVTAPTINRATDLTRTSFTINWTITNSSNIHSYLITWTNLHNGDMDNVEVKGNTTSYNVTGLNGFDNYNVSVTAKNPCGIMESDSITVYGKDILIRTLS